MRLVLPFLRTDGEAGADVGRDDTEDGVNDDILLLYGLVSDNNDGECW